jgi:catechol 2,3-dioxygenase-like lactoylglutathione lyase family enzyme
MRPVILSVIFLFAASPNWAQQNNVPRPPILGISHVRFHVSQLEPADHFYRRIIAMDAGSGLCKNPVPPQLTCLWVGTHQFVELDPGAQRRPDSLLEEVAFATPDVVTMSQYLLSRGLHYENVAGHDLVVRDDAGRMLSFSVLDPEGNRVIFEPPTKRSPSETDHEISKAIIHAGFVVHDRAAEDQFYKGILGFHLYWHGGMKDDQDNWVAMQVPDGTDWVEYMLNVPPDANKHTLGVMNHIALGVEDIHATRERLVANGWTPKEEPKVGRDGKYQLNLYDPDETRMEFMEFTPKEKPCCSEFTGKHPSPKP